LITGEGFPNAEGAIIGKTVPISFGKLAKAQFVRTANKDTTIQNIGFFGFLNATPQGVSIFKVDSVTDSLNYTIKVSDNLYGETSPLLNNNIVDSYLFIVEDTNEKGSFRRITAFASSGADKLAGVINVTIAKHFENDLTSSTWLSIRQIEQDYQSDVWEGKDFLDDSGSVIAETPTLFSFDTETDLFISLPQVGVKIKTGANNNLLDIDADFFDSSPDNLTGFYIIKPASVSALSDGDLSAWNNAEHPSAQNIAKDTSGIYKSLATTGEGTSYTHVISAQSVLVSPNDVAKITDEDSTTFGQISFRERLDAETSTTQIGIVVAAFSLSLPAIPGNLSSWTNLNLVVNYDYAGDFVSGLPSSFWSRNANLMVYTRRFVGASTNTTNLTGLSPLAEGSADSNAAHQAKMFLDEYFSDAPTTNNEFFFKQADTTILVQGYKSIDLGAVLTDDGLYDAAQEMVLFVRANINSSVGTAGNMIIDHTLKVYEIALLFEKAVSIKNEIFSGLSGRIFDDSWDGRKTSANLITGPVPILEHVNRLQNWSENNKSPADGWGKGYAFGAKIRLSSVLASNAASAQKNVTVTSTEGKRFRQGDVVFIMDSGPNSEQNRIDTIAGDVLTMETNLANSYTTANGAVVDGSGSFDGGTDTDLDAISGFLPARQVLSEQEANTDRLKRSLAKNFWMGVYVDKHGRECVKRLLRADQNINPSETLTLSDMVDRRSIKIINPNPSDVFAEPFVRFNKNSATGEFESAIRVTNVDFENPTGAQKQTFIEGLEGGSAELLWDKANALYLKVNQITNPPSDMTDLSWVDAFDVEDREVMATDYITNACWMWCNQTGSPAF